MGFPDTLHGQGPRGLGLFSSFPSSAPPSPEPHNLPWTEATWVFTLTDGLGRSFPLPWASLPPSLPLVAIFLPGDLAAPTLFQSWASIIPGSGPAQLSVRLPRS